MCLDTLQDNRQPDAGTGHVTALFPAALEERFEYPRPFLLGYARARVREIDHEAGRLAARPDRDQTPSRGEFHRIRQQIIEHRAQFVAIRVHNYVFDFEPQLDTGRLECEPLFLRDADDDRAVPAGAALGEY